MPEERWKKIYGFPNYSVSDQGRVRSDRTGKIRAVHAHNFGHMQVILYRNQDGKRYARMVTQLVARAFLPGYHSSMKFIIHKNNLLSDNRAVNLKLPERTVKRLSKAQSKSRPKRKDSRVEVVETGEVFKDARAAAEALGGAYTSIYRHLRGQQAHHYGYHLVWHVRENE